jgi:hypothetical protein
MPLWQFESSDSACELKSPAPSGAIAETLVEYVSGASDAEIGTFTLLMQCISVATSGER